MVSCILRYILQNAVIYKAAVFQPVKKNNNNLTYGFNVVT